MTAYKFTEYFERQVLCKRSQLKKESCLYVVENTIHFDVLLFSLSENEVSFTDKGGNVKTYKLVYVYISPSPGQLSDNRMRSVSFSDKGEYWGNGNLQLIDEEGNATNLDITDGVGRFSLF